MSDHTPEKAHIGTYAPRCPRCGWQAIDRPYTEETHDARYAEARADVAAHGPECPGQFRDSLSDFIDRYTPRCEACVAEAFDIASARDPHTCGLSTPPADGSEG